MIDFHMEVHALLEIVELQNIVNFFLIFFTSFTYKYCVLNEMAKTLHYEQEAFLRY